MKLRGATLDEIVRDGDARDLVEAATACMFAAQDARRPYEARWERYYKQYRNQLTFDRSPWQSDLALPITFALVETIAPRLVAATPTPIARPLSPEGVEVAKKMEDWLRWASHETLSGFRRKSRAAIKNSLIYGTGLLKTFWRYEERITRKNVPSGVLINNSDDGNLVAERDFNSAPMMVEEIRKYADHPDFESISPWDIYPAPYATNERNAEYVVHRTTMPMRAVKAFVDAGIFESRVLDELDRNNWIDPSDNSVQTLAAMMNNNTSQAADTDMIRNVLVWEFWVEPGLRFTILNKSIVANVTDKGRYSPWSHGQKPFVLVRDHELDNEFWGIGSCEAISDIQRELNNLRNQRQDAVNLSLSPMYIVREGALDFRQVTHRPGGVIRVDGWDPIDDMIRELPRPNVPAVAYEESNFLVQMANECVGVTDYARGADSPTRDTATEVSVKAEGTNARFALKSENLDSAIAVVWEHWLHLGKQFAEAEALEAQAAGRQPESKFIPRLRPALEGEDPNKDFIELTQEDFSLDLRLQVKPASMQETSVEAKMEVAQRVQFIFGNELAGAHFGWQGQRAVLKDMLEADGILDADTYLQGEEPQPMGPEGMPPGMAGQMPLPGMGQQVPPEMMGQMPPDILGAAQAPEDDTGYTPAEVAQLFGGQANG